MKPDSHAATHPAPHAAPPAVRPRINLALQGGGSHGAFTWGVLDAILEDGRIDIDGISGTSAGAMNAVALASGWCSARRKGAAPADVRQAARDSLKTFWESVGAMGTFMGSLPGRDNPLMGMMSQWLSPYNTNPLGLNPLLNLLNKQLDFTALQHPAADSDPKVFVCATNVRTGRGEIFSGKTLTADAVMASACLPLLFQAVQIGKEHYWDGGFSGNPALYPLIYQTTSNDVLLIQINPIAHDDLPDTPQEIADRMNEVTFNAGLLAELRAIQFVTKLLDEERLDANRYKKMLLHRVDGGTPLAQFGASSKSRADLAFLRQMFGMGRDAGQNWIHKHLADLGVRATMKLDA